VFYYVRLTESDLNNIRHLINLIFNGYVYNFYIVIENKLT